MARKTLEDAVLLYERARRYRELAAHEDDPDRAALFLELAEALERGADLAICERQLGPD